VLAGSLRQAMSQATKEGKKKFKLGKNEFVIKTTQKTAGGKRTTRAKKVTK
jgi:hypothetical protein